jgi:hypothetical protein
MMEPLWTASDDSDTAPQHARYALPIAPFSAISPAFVARLIKGCRGDDVPVVSIRKNRALSTL